MIAFLLLALGVALLAGAGGMALGSRRGRRASAASSEHWQRRYELLLQDHVAVLERQVAQTERYQESLASLAMQLHHLRVGRREEPRA